MRKTLQTLVLTFITLLLFTSSKTEPQPENTDFLSQPNILLIAVDDLNTFNTVLGDEAGVFLEKIYPDSAQRNSVLKKLTPNLERFSEKALTFRNAYCASPLCGPSRTALLTGIPAHVSGYYHHDKHFRGYESLTKAVTLPQFFKQNGYFTSGIGKVFHKGRSYLDRGYFSDWPDQIYSWTHWIEAHSGTGASAISPERGTETLSKFWEQGKRSSSDFTRFGKTDLKVEYSNDFVNATHIAKLIIEGESSFKDINGLNQEVTLPGNQPWFLACGIFAPHLPWIARQEFFDLFPQEEMKIDKELLEWVNNDLQDLSPTGKRITMNTGFSRLLKHGREISGSNGDIAAWKEMVQAYLATIVFSDYCIGVLVDAIENNPEKENTVVVLFSDHGYHMGDKNRDGKTTLWEASNHCNLMIYDPRIEGASSGKKAVSGASLQDIYPTLVDLAGLEKPGHIYGYSLKPVLENPELPWSKPVLSTFEEGNHTIRTEHFRYLRFANGDRELYHINSDFFELKNLANLPDWEDKLKEMDVLLNQKLQMKPADFATY